jgi:transporter family-2 protein
VTSAAVALTLLAGLAASVQVAVMGRFGQRIGVVEALTFATTVQLVLSLMILLVARVGTGGLGGAFRAPVWMWSGGLIGALIDRFGLFGVDQIALTWPRLVGIVLLGAGAALSLAR